MIAIIGIPASNICVAVVCRKWGAPHLRHAFATYHYEDGTDLLTLKALMGHRSISSTVIYVHLSSRILSSSPSPFDKMGGMILG